MSNKINTSRLHKKNSFAVEWVITCEEGTQIKDLTDPNYYCHVANRFHKNDIIRAFFDDGSYVVDLLILETDKSNITPVWVKTIITNIIDIEKSKNFTSQLKSESNKKDKVKSEESFQNEYVSVMFRGPVGKWSVIRKEDKVVLREKIGTKEEANQIANEISNQINDR